MKYVSIRENPSYAEKAIRYFQEKWGSEETNLLYEDCITSCLTSPSKLPQWYLLLKDETIVGCAGLIPNDFISRMDLYPWLCALYIEEEFRGNSYGELLIEHVKTETKKLGFETLYLCTDHTSYYEKYQFDYLGVGYHPWGESSRIYQTKLVQ
ncbi:GNAT family N-acetyltransferase [Carnobacterium divergens]|uniref:GNAT family N-acetyltransferase n=1 Tax=Carnobacterium divergens TaxID=2748 RepID=UPI000E757402|nr:GNAT family N-acetyltransferase [Carnobacterium divergens]AOA00561.1 GNAT family N-acetyltransferase [Carnobacterium divergens]